MNLNPEQLQTHLKKSLLPVYLITSDEPLLLQESADLIRQTAKLSGFLEHEVYHITAQQNWDEFLNQANNLSLFADKKLIELRFTQKPNAKATSAIMRYLEESTLDQNVLLITLPKLDASQKRSKWFQSIEKIGASIIIWPISSHAHPQWLQARLQAKGLSITQEGLTLLSQYTEGNLLAAQQAIEKLALLYPNKNILDDSHIQGCLNDNAHFDVFNLVDYCLLGQTKRIGTILDHLRHEGIEPTLVLWAISRSVRQLIEINELMSQGKPLEQCFVQLKLWEKQKISFRHFFKKQRSKHLFHWLQLIEQIDQQIKGLSTSNPWEYLFELCLCVASQEYQYAFTT